MKEELFLVSENISWYALIGRTADVANAVGGSSLSS